jgi:hypothetical protein
MSSKNIDKGWSEQGYNEGMVVYQKDSDCPFIIITENSKQKLDPINIEDAEFTAFKQDGIRILFKYKSLRQMNRCDNTIPIQLEAIIKNDD